jgi:hypothetical protein
VRRASIERLVMSPLELRVRMAVVAGRDTLRVGALGAAGRRATVRSHDYASRAAKVMQETATSASVWFWDPCKERELAEKDQDRSTVADGRKGAHGVGEARGTRAGRRSAIRIPPS